MSIVASLGSAPERLPVEAAMERLTPKTGTSSKNIRTTIRCRARLRFECHGRSRPSHQLLSPISGNVSEPVCGSNKRRAVQPPVMCGPIYFQSFTRFRSFTAQRSPLCCEPILPYPVKNRPTHNPNRHPFIRAYAHFIPEPSGSPIPEPRAHPFIKMP